MPFSDLSTIQLHFILGKERTGSSMLTAMLNENRNVISPSEEPFLLYFRKKYQKKDYWSKTDIKTFLKKFWWLHEKSLAFYFSDFNTAFNSLVKLTENKKLCYLDFCKCVYLQFLPHKNKSEITHIIDKQLKYSFYSKRLFQVSPESKIVFITRDPRDNVTRCQSRKIGKTQNTSYQAQLWNEYYRNVERYKKTYGNNLKIIKYEDLVKNPKQCLQIVCDHFGINYSDQMLQFNVNVKDFLATKNKEKINQPFGNKIADFHSSLLEPVNSSKAGAWKNEASRKDIKIIEKITYDIAMKLGYEIPKTQLSLTIPQYFMITFAKINKTLLLKFYLWLPLDMKILIKRIRGKKIDS